MESPNTRPVTLKCDVDVSLNCWTNAQVVGILRRHDAHVTSLWFVCRMQMWIAGTAQPMVYYQHSPQQVFAQDDQPPPSTNLWSGVEEWWHHNGEAWVTSYPVMAVITWNCCRSQNKRVPWFQSNDRNAPYNFQQYSDVLTNAMASQLTGVLIVCPNVRSGTDQRKHQSSASLAFVRGIHRWRVYSPHKGPVTRKTFPFYDIIMSIDVDIDSFFLARMWLPKKKTKKNEHSITWIWDKYHLKLC